VAIKTYSREGARKYAKNKFWQVSEGKVQKLGLKLAEFF
jgi:hypothetical protein